jgi:hypothetical protein
MNIMLTRKTMYITRISRSPGRPATEFLQWHLIFAVYLQVTCCLSRFWRLEFRGGFQVAGKFVDPCITTLPDVVTVYILHTVTSKKTRVFSNTAVTSYPATGVSYSRTFRCVVCFGMGHYVHSQFLKTCVEKCPLISRTV